MICDIKYWFLCSNESKGCKIRLVGVYSLVKEIGNKQLNTHAQSNEYYEENKWNAVINQIRRWRAAYDRIFRGVESLQRGHLCEGKQAMLQAERIT